MKPLLILALCLPLLTGCTTLDAKNGRYFTAGDNQRVKMDFRNGQITHYEAESNVHSPIVRAHWHGVVSVGAEAVAWGAGGPIVGGGTAAITSLVNRPTTRTPRP